MPGPAPSKHSAIAETGAYEQEERSWALRLQGHSVASIADILSVSRATANRRLRAARERVVAETNSHVEEWRTEQLAQLDQIIGTAHALRMAAVTTDPDTGEERVNGKMILEANASILRAVDQKAKLTGTYAAVAVDVTATVTHVDAKDAELASMLDKLGPRVETAPQQ